MSLRFFRSLAGTVAAVIIFLTLPSGWCLAPPNGDSPEARSQSAARRLVVKITGMRNTNGSLLIALYRGPKGFPDSDSDAAAHQAVRLLSGSATTVTFDGLKPGEYAVSLFHDENDNGTLDTSLGFPLEGFGTSNNPPLRWRAPNFKESRFTVASDQAETTISIQMRYLCDDPMSRP